MALPLLPPWPSGPWQEVQKVANASAPRRASPGDCAAYGGTPPIGGSRRAHDRIPLTSTPICASVSIPPLLFANGGICVPRTPPAATFRSVASSTIARYTGSLNAIDAPPFPSIPWQPEQLSL